MVSVGYFRDILLENLELMEIPGDSWCVLKYAAHE